MIKKIAQLPKVLKLFLFLILSFIYVLFFQGRITVLALEYTTVYESDFTYISDAELNIMLDWYNSRLDSFKIANPDFHIVSYPQTWSNGTLTSKSFKAKFYFKNNACSNFRKNVIQRSIFYSVDGGYGAYATSTECKYATYVLDNNNTIKNVTSNIYSDLFYITTSRLSEVNKVVYSTYDMLIGIPDEF